MLAHVLRHPRSSALSAIFDNVHRRIFLPGTRIGPGVPDLHGADEPLLIFCIGSLNFCPKNGSDQIGIKRLEARIFLGKKVVVVTHLLLDGTVVAIPAFIGQAVHGQ